MAVDERTHLWERAGWPDLSVDLARLLERLTHASFAQGRIVGALGGLTPGDCASLEADALAATALASAALSGDRHDDAQIAAQIARALATDGRDPNPAAPAGTREAGIVATTIDARRAARAPLTVPRLQRWHAWLLADDAAPAWRGAETPAQGVPVERIASEIDAYLAWLAAPAAYPALVQCALAHIRLLAIRPFAAGNGRLSRAIADLVLGCADAVAAPTIALARQLQVEAPAYAAARERAFAGDVDVTAWAAWFIDCYVGASAQTIAAIDGFQRATTFWRQSADIDLNARQRRVLERCLAGAMADAITSRVYRQIAGTSPDSAQRDLADLAQKNIIVANPGKARKTSYRLREDFFVRR